MRIAKLIAARTFWTLTSIAFILVSGLAMGHFCY